jgi:hypothetical protein
MIEREQWPVLEADLERIEAVRVMMRLSHVTTKPGLKAACYRDAGVHLKALRHTRVKADWAEIVQRFCPVSVSRAYELMAIAGGKKTVAGVRAENAARRRTHSRKKSKA